MNGNIISIFTEVQEDFGYEQKERLIAVIAKEFRMSPHSVRSNWLSRGDIPEYRQERTLQIAQNFLRELNLNQEA